MNPRRLLMIVLSLALLVCAAKCFLNCANLLGFISGVNGVNGFEEVARSARTRCLVYGIAWVVSEISLLTLLTKRTRLSKGFFPELMLMPALFLACAGTLGFALVLSALHFGSITNGRLP